MNEVSIIIPCYNAEKWIEQCVLSALNQDYDEFEVIAVDNESTDNSLEILYKIQEKHPELIVATAKNIYPHCWDEACEKGFSISSGEYITRLASDDFLGSEYIENCIEEIQGSDAIQSGIINCGDVDNKYGHLYKYESVDEFKQLCMNSCPVNSPTLFCKRTLYEKELLKTKPEIYSGYADYDLYCSLADNNIFIYSVEKYLGYYYRWHSEQATWEMHKKTIDYNKLIQDYWRAKWFPTTVLAK